MKTHNPLPPKEREEWLLMVRGNLEHKFQNYALQMKTHHLSLHIKSGKITETQAIEELYALCEKYSLAVAPDLNKIFN